jgi:hypothetical protein
MSNASTNEEGNNITPVTPNTNSRPDGSANEAPKMVSNVEKTNKSDDSFDWGQLKPSRLYQDWRTLQIGNQPLPDPPDYVDDSNFKKFYRLPLKHKIQVLKHTFSESIDLYKTYVTWYVDQELSDKKVKEILKKDEEILAEIDRKAKERKEMNDPDSIAASKELEDTIETALKVYRENIAQVKDIKSAVSTAIDNQDTIKTFAAKKLETVGMIIRDFMSGYKEGKEIGVVDALRDDGFVGDILRSVKEKDFDGVKSKVESKVGSVMKEYSEFDPAVSKAETLAEDSLMGKFVNMRDKIDTKIDSVVKEYKEFDETSSRAQSATENGLLGKFVNISDKVDAKVDSVVKEYKEFDEASSKAQAISESEMLKKFVTIKEQIDEKVDSVVKEYKEYTEHKDSRK